MNKIPKMWTFEQEKALNNLYKTLFGEQSFTLEQKSQFWNFYTVQNKIKISYSSPGEITGEDKKISLVMLMEYSWLDSHNLIRL